LVFREEKESTPRQREMDGKEMSKWACNRGGKAVWWGLFRVWFGLVIEREREIGRESKR
jgi:hypothetical protein